MFVCQVFIGSSGRPYGSGVDYVNFDPDETVSYRYWDIKENMKSNIEVQPIWEHLPFRVRYEIEMVKVTALDQPGSRCFDASDDGANNLALCIEDSLNEKVNCSVGLMAMVYDNRRLCNRRADSRQFDIINESELNLLLAKSLLQSAMHKEN